MTADSDLASGGELRLAAGDATGSRPSHKKRKRFPHGNYTGYYITRYGRSRPDCFSREEPPGASDPRLSLLERSWFEGKKCLDVGCNEGHLTLAIVQRFRPRRMVGIDIDAHLVDRAREVLATEIRSGAEAARERVDRADASHTFAHMNGCGKALRAGAGAVRPLMPRSLRNAVKPNAACTDEPIDQRGTFSDGAPGTAAAPMAPDGKKKVEKSHRNPRKSGADNGGTGAPCDTRALTEQTPESEACSIEGPGTNGYARDERRSRAPNGEGDGPRIATPSSSFVSCERGGTGEEDTMHLSGCAVSFLHEDFTLADHPQSGYDAICLFSVVKWMHINGGDEAMRRVFRHTHALLRPGGRLVLEPQPWKSYRKSVRQHGSPEARTTIDGIRLRPTDFPALLTKEVGFRSWDEVGQPGEGVGGFARRSIHVFVK